MAPIRVGFIGLSKAGWARNAHLPYLKASPDYEIVALCNSSLESAQEVIKLYGLPSTVKAYGDPEALAADSTIDLVVCSVRVDRHLATIGPSLKAGKNVYVEWPLGRSAKEARELLRLKEEGGVKKAVVGLQARQAPEVRKLKDLIEGGRLGKVLSSYWSSAADQMGQTVVERLEYFTRKAVGGNIMTIHTGHSLDYIQHVLGYGFSSISSLLANRRPTIALLGPDGKAVDPSHPKDTDDTVFIHGTLASGIPLSYTLRGGPPFKGTPGLDWRIYGETGEIRVTASGPFLQIGYEDTKIEVHEFASDTVEVVSVEKDEENELVMPGRNVGRLYKGYAKGEINCSFEDAVERHELIEKLYAENGYTEV